MGKINDPAFFFFHHIPKSCLYPSGRARSQPHAKPQAAGKGGCHGGRGVTGTSLSCPRGGRETVTHLPPARPWSSFLFLVMLKENSYFFIGFVTYEPCRAIPEVSQGHLCPQQSPVVFRWVSRLSVTQFPHLRASRRMGSTPHLSFRPKSGGKDITNPKNAFP